MKIFQVTPELVKNRQEYWTPDMKT